MKRVLCLVLFLLIVNPVFAETQKAHKSVSKCLDLETAMYDKRAILYNILNLTPDQQKCKDTMDNNFQKEIGDKYEKYSQEKYVLSNLKKHNASKASVKKQEKVVKNIEKQIKNIQKKYDKEFLSVLTSEQRAKMRNISAMEKFEKWHYTKQKAFYQHDSKLRTFGDKMYYDNETQNVLCPVHNKYHMFGIKHKVKTK